MEEELGLKGGQGRTAEDLWVSAVPICSVSAAFIILVIVMAVVMLTGCKPSNRPVADPDARPRPSPKELRHCCPM